MEESGSLTGNHRTIAEVNKALVLRYIRERGPISAPDLARLSKLSPSTTTACLRQALREGLVEVAGIGASRGGRKPLLFRLSPGMGFAICLEIETSHISAAIVDFDGNIVDSAIEPIPQTDADSVIKASVSIVRSLQERAPNLRPTLGVGVSCPGTVNSKDGVVMTAVNLNWHQPVPLAAKLRRALKMPVYVYNDADAAALGERYFGVGKGVHDLVYVLLETGVGAGLIVDDNLHPGRVHNAGNIGHTVVVKDGLACACGDHGCLEAYCSGPAIVGRIVNVLLTSSGGSSPEESLSQVRTLEQVIDLANQGDEVCANALSEAGKYLSIALVNLVHVMAPELVVLGELLSHSEHIVRPVREALEKRFNGQVKVEISSLGRKAKILGTATGLLEGAFGPSIVEGRG